MWPHCRTIPATAGRFLNNKTFLVGAPLVCQFMSDQGSCEFPQMKGSHCQISVVKYGKTFSWSFAASRSQIFLISLGLKSGQMVHGGSPACYSYGCEAYRLKYVKMPAFAGTAESSNTIWKHCYRIWWLLLLHRLGKTQPEGRVKGSPATSAQHLRDISAVPGDEHGVAKHWVVQNCSRPCWPPPAQHLPSLVGFGQSLCRSAFRGFPEDQGWDDGGFWPMRSPVLRALPGPAARLCTQDLAGSVLGSEH